MNWFRTTFSQTFERAASPFKRTGSPFKKDLFVYPCVSELLPQVSRLKDTLMISENNIQLLDEAEQNIVIYQWRADQLFADAEGRGK